ncbi:MAG: response regulator [Anaerolineales bacterium]|nr:response regulator [Anaerolineales bacterium]
MPKPSEKILIADEDPDVVDLVARQTLGPLGYSMAAASDGPGAIHQIMTFHPDIVIASLTLLGLSAKEILVALRAQGLESLVIVTAPEGQEKAALQAFRLGAKDYLAKPLREAEVVSSVERALSEVRLRKEREALALRLSEANQQLEHRVKELTLLFGIGKAMVSLNHLDRLFDRLMEGARYATETEMGWLLQRDDEGRALLLRSQHGLPASLAAKLNLPWDDGVSPLVIASGEALRLSGAGLQRFKIAQVCRSVLVAPIKAKTESLGVIAVGHKEARDFTVREQTMLEAVADYASIAMINARLFRALENRAAAKKAPPG